ncbi:fibrillin-1-like isoform X4 [Biomphalaria glabrata]|uniref:Fibrillin-1-like isoform X4 n=1 Tax=Biomphalaria glabrata TaxID=6526 RepID=A0A9W2Y9U9_BIOGL|nr:fibrillin-1-like isoform X4 [Biomphalaria glabrata]
MIYRALIYFCVYTRLVCVIAGSDVTTFNQDNDFVADDNIDQLLQTEQFLKVKDNQDHKKSSIRGTPLLGNVPSAEEKISAAQAQSKKTSTTHNCTNSESRHGARANQNSSLQLKWESLDALEESEEEYLSMGLDFDFIPTQEEARHYRYRRASTFGVGSGESLVSGKLTLADGTLTTAEATEGNPANTAKKTALETALQTFLAKKIPRNRIVVKVRRLTRGSIIVDFEMIFGFDDASGGNISSSEIAGAFSDLRTLAVGNATYSVNSVMVSDSEGTLKPLVCYNCKVYQHCIGSNPECVMKEYRLYPYGPAQTDSQLPKDSEFVTRRYTIQDYIPWDNQLVRTIYISVNGLISFDEEFSSYLPRRLPVTNKKLLAVYWSDLDIVSGDVGQVYCQMYSKSGNLNKTIFNLANKDVMNYGGVDFYDASLVIVVTWYDVAPYPLSDAERVTFQCVIISDGETTYAIYTYANGALQFNPVLQRDLELGWGSYNLDPRRSNYYNFDSVIGNTGETGRWIFKIGERENFRSKCLNWFQENVDNFWLISIWNSIIPQCPCNELSAFSSGLWLPSFEENKCYDSFPRYGSFGRRCCYQGSFGFGSFESRIPKAGSFQAATPYGGRYLQQLHEQYDVLPKRWCCDLSNLCNLYYAVRPSPRCTNSFNAIAASIGDPHIVTLDGQSYVFNGKGEYTILQIVGPDPANNSLSINYQLQGRTCQATNAAGNLTSATVWCALAFKTSTSSSVRVELGTTGNYMVIYANGQDYTQRFRDNINFSEMNKDLFLRNVNSSLKVSTSDNIGITISLANKLLEFTVDIDDKYRTMTKGLMGNFNGDKSDDFIFPNGTKLSNNSSEREIFAYGYSWLIKEDSSLFVYPYGTNFSSFTDLNFKPIFMDEVSDTVRKDAEKKCGSQTNLPCIFDYIATQNEDLAKNSMASSDTFESQSNAIANQAPFINGTSAFNITLNSPLSFVLQCSDPDKDSFTINVSSGLNHSFDSATGELSITFTPTKITNETFQIVLKDSKGMESQPYVAELTVCTNCSGHGVCNFEDNQEVNPYYSLASCDCRLGYTGTDCEMDKDGCINSPCPASTNCTDVPAEEEIRTGKSYKCSDCPPGFQLNVNGTKCEDINECNRTVSPCDANANCLNTIGSFQCTCKSGYRMQISRCVDINECTENLHDCQQICINEPSTYSCDCYDGFQKTGLLLHDCFKNTSSDPCANLNKTCVYGCRNNSGSAECFCEVGYKLKPDGVGCEDIDECKENLCSQECNNTVGSYTCSCYVGYQLSSRDKRVCEACSNNLYGVDCKSTCNCRGRASACDNVKGCLCNSGWTGVSCDTDVNECVVTPDICPRDQICTNTNGSYTCTCPAGFQLVNGICTNIDECASVITNNCSQLCTDNPGSYSCSCQNGYTLLPNNTCQNINECFADIDGCEQDCEDVEGSYNCKCNAGYTLTADRKSCEKIRDPCENLSINCSYGCTIINNTAQCFCQIGYILGTDGATCFDINECTVTGVRQHKCSDLCVNTPGSYNCSCPIGKVLQNDRRTCQVCDSYHWGPGCANNCSCYPIGSETCDPVIGCKCKSGWAGTKCMQDINECDSETSPCPLLSICMNTPGSYYCQCPSGYKLFNNTCIDIDECVENKPCDQICTNVPGSYRCSCFRQGFRVNGSKCVDIDECSVSTLNNCEQLCRNTEGSFACDCNDGYILNTTTRSTCDRLSTTKTCANTTCSQICNIVSDLEVCSCHSGYTLHSDNKTCFDTDECKGTNPCQNGVCNNVNGSFYCTCSNGSKLSSDMITCQPCDFGLYGANCNSSCLCNTTNTITCNATNGQCQCKSGWDSDYCSVDIDECTNNVCPNNSRCINSPGSYRCVCNPGYYSNGQVCSICDSTRFGQDCARTCTCNFANTVVCNHTNGQCNCKPGWEGVNCDQDINECSNTSYCSGSFVQCINLNGSAECRCTSGYEKPNSAGTCQDVNECLNSLLNTCGGSTDCVNTDGSYKCVCANGYYEVSGVCTPCNATSFGVNCSQTCTCIEANTLDCNDKTGVCTCLPGWNGSICDLDIDECLLNANFCTDPNSFCLNLNGSVLCECETGFYRPFPGNFCQVCEPNHYGPNCAQQCSCMMANTADCDDVNGTCTCKPGWTGLNCDHLVDQCSNTTLCTAGNETCYNISGTATCDCLIGFHRPTSGGPCQGCDSTHWGQNCSNVCQCDVSNSQDCNDVNGTCTCKPGWTGTNCKQDIDECSINLNFCTNLHEVCHNLNGSAECICQNGFFKPNSSASCEACNSTHYGPNCAHQCTCMMTNTADCNDVNGTCTCKPGWTGTNCDQDINECAINSSFCTNLNESCHNLNGSAECICKVGYYRPTTSDACQACDSTHWGQNCSNVCQCDVSNSLDCNDVNGTCSCKTGWNGTNCDQDIDECAINSSFCTNSNESCHNLNGSAECICKVGYYRPTTSDVCQACDSTHWGQNCSNVCQCDVSNSLDCNDVNGTCSCKTGWNGTNCDQDIDECAINSSFCTNSNESCHNLNGSAECICKVGFYKPTTSDECQACNATHYGENCQLQCSCLEGNTLDCNHVNGTCTCESGWSGTNCDLDIDECVTNTSYCSGPEETCQNLNGSAECLCHVGFYRPSSEKDCQACNSTRYGPNCTLQCNCMMANTADCDDVNGTCTCRVGWNGTNCDQDIDECDNTSYCAGPEETCHNLNGSAECLCQDGYYRPTGSQCQACNSTQYGPNCALQCSCMTANTANCNNVNGTCTCNPGWTGLNCGHLVDQCSNTTLCTSANETCYNISGTATCDCLIGFHRPTSGGACQGCDSTHWGQNCSNVCQCDVSNSLDCNDVNGTCTCESGWNGTNCNQDIDECAINRTVCTNLHEVCHNLNGSAECVCQDGFFKPNSSASCQACNSTHYGPNCAHQCKCMMTNTDDCNDVNGTCSCKPGWTGTNCDLDIDECVTNTSYCTGPEETCLNLNGSAECLCHVGFYRPSSEKDCQACNSTRYGPNCALQCNCMMANTADCDDVNGTCTCRVGWNGTNCDQDIDECVTNTNYCPGPEETCHNLNGSAECLCQDGFYRPTSGSQCQACNSTQYGPNCALQCSCMMANTANCNNVNGTCTCNPGWTGLNCGHLVDQCSNTTLCTAANETCYNISGTATCDCLIGFHRPTSGGSCQGCDSTHWGQNCSNVCQCDVSNSLDCNDVNGTCTCESGWNGTNCNQDIDECAINRTVCTNLHEVCHNLNGSAECVCQDGFFKPNSSASCQACNSTHYGPNCAHQCNCMMTNTDDCNDVNGTCTCKPGWTGTNCDQDIDECAINSSFCTNSNESCHNLNGSAECICKVGYYRPTTSDACQACDPTHYGPNCAHQCSCMVANTADCDDVSGTCTCKPSWTGLNCDHLLDQCTNKTFCTAGNETCYNISGTATCDCLIGFHRPGVSCEGCDSTHWGQNCSNVCQCDVSNSLDCNDVNGTCTCEPGWTGTKCDQDIDECAINLSLCNNSNEVCHNLNGSAECICQDGFFKPNSSATCQACNSTHYGPNCAHQCNCMMTNTADCNDVNGTCTCNPGWTGLTCGHLVDQCTNSSFCTAANETCYNISGTATCDCRIGFHRPTSGGSCQGCDSTHWGQNCSNVCQCNDSNSLDCNDINGTCTCKTGWTGTNCDQDIDECAIYSTFCTNLYEVCHNLKGSAECVCQNGFYRPTAGAACQGCDSTHWGQNCSNVCQCAVTNSLDCNDVSGTCTCKPGWTGTKCDLKKVCDSTHYGPTCASECTCDVANTIDCNSENGACTCKDSWTGANCNQVKSLSASVTMPIKNPPLEVLNTSSSVFFEYRATILAELRAISSRNFGQDIVIIHIISFRLGSLIADIIMEISGTEPNVINDPTTNTAANFTNFLIDVTKSSVNINGTDYPFTLSLNGVNVTSNTTKCAIYMRVTNITCLDCVFEDGNAHPTCSVSPVSDSDGSNDLIIGLAVGIPLFVILTVVVLVLVCLYVRRKSSKNLGSVSEERESPFGRFFPTRLDPKGSWGTPSLYKADAYSEAGTSQNSRDGQLIRKTKKKSPEFQDSAWYASTSSSVQPAAGQEQGVQEPPTGQASNFSWDYMFQLLEPHKGFEIQRPNVSPSPNPAFLKKGPDSNA